MKFILAYINLNYGIESLIRKIPFSSFDTPIICTEEELCIFYYYQMENRSKEFLRTSIIKVPR